MKILLLDVEISPTVATVWGLFKQNVALNQIMGNSEVLTWVAKWHGDKDTIDGHLMRDGKKRMLRKMHRLLTEADAVVTWNGNGFDLKVLNAEFLLAGLNPPSPFRSIDLLATARRKFRFTSNKLDYVAQRLGLGSKVKHRGHDMWMDCMARKREAFDEMLTYNTMDVILLERIYDRLLPWVPNHPNRNNYGEHHVCPKCGSEKHQRRGYAITSTRRYARMQCLGCGTWFRSTDCEPGRASYVEAA